MSPTKSWITGSHCKRYTGVLIVVHLCTTTPGKIILPSSINLKRGDASNIADTVTELSFQGGMGGTAPSKNDFSF